MEEYNVTPSFLFAKYTKKERKEQLQRCVRAYYSDMLKNEGFVSYKDEGLSWYRIINHEVVQSVHLYLNSLRWSRLCMGYAAHPLYLVPWVPFGITYSQTGPWGDEIMTQDLYPHSECIFDNDTPISCPLSEKNGAERLTDIVFPILRQIHTERDAYLFHKQRRKSIHPPDVIASVISAEFCDEVVYFEDEEMYPACLKRAKQLVGIYERFLSLNKYEMH
ncbi:MAG: hypothetical protein ACI4V3_03470 [Faecousia sp.]